MDFFCFGHALRSDMNVLRVDTILKQLPDASFLFADLMPHQHRLQPSFPHNPSAANNSPTSDHYMHRLIKTTRPGYMRPTYLPVELWYFRESIWNLLPAIRHEPVQYSKHQAAHLHIQFGKRGHHVLNLFACITIEVVALVNCREQVRKHVAIVTLRDDDAIDSSTVGHGGNHEYWLIGLKDRPFDVGKNRPHT